MFNKNNHQIHYGQGDQHIHQNTTNTITLNNYNGESNEDSYKPFSVLIIGVVLFVIMNEILGISQDYNYLIIGTEASLLSFAYKYLYSKDQNLNSLKNQIIISALNLITVIFLVTNKAPEPYQTIFNNNRLQLDVTSIETILKSFFDAISHFISDSQQLNSPIKTALCICYPILASTNIIIPITTSINLFLKKSVKVVFIAVITFTYWIIFYLLHTVS